MVCGQDRTTATFLTLGSRSRIRRASSSVSTEASGAFIGARAAASTSSGVRTVVPVALTWRSRSQSDPYRAQVAKPPSARTRTSARASRRPGVSNGVPSRANRHVRGAEAGGGPVGRFLSPRWAVLDPATLPCLCSSLTALLGDRLVHHADQQ